MWFYFNEKSTCNAFGSRVIASVLTAFADDAVKILEGSYDKSCRTDQGCFSPFDITIDVGETITWTKDSVPHDLVTWDGPERIGETFQWPTIYW